MKLRVHRQFFFCLPSVVVLLLLLMFKVRNSNYDNTELKNKKQHTLRVVTLLLEGVELPSETFIRELEWVSVDTVVAALMYRSKEHHQSSL